MHYILLFLMLLQCFYCRAQLQIGKIMVNGKLQTQNGDSVSLKPGDNSFLIEYGAIKGDSIHYLYRLEGADQAWVASSFPVARYTGIEPGTSLFEMKAMEGNTAIGHSRIFIKKEQGFWNKWWFFPSIAVYVMMLIGVSIYLFLLYDFRQKLRMQQVRNRIAADLHDEVGSNLNSISIFVEVLRKKAPPEMHPVLEKIIANSKESVALMQDTVWTINPQNDSIQKLFDKMESFASDVLSSKEIVFDFKVETDLGNISFTMDQRKSLYLIYKEAINNVVKHAEATMVKVRVSRLKDMIQIGIEDNGKGFDMHTESNGNGLGNFRERAREAGIALMIESERGKGTLLRTQIAV